MNTLAAFFVGMSVGACLVVLYAISVARSSEAEHDHRGTHQAGGHSSWKADAPEVAALKATIAHLDKVAGILAAAHAERTEYSGTRGIAEMQSDHDWSAKEWREWAAREAGSCR